MEKKHKKLLDDCLWELGNTVWNEEELCYCITELIKVYQENTKEKEDG